MDRIIAIDPGVTGAYALKEGDIVSVHDLPAIVTKKRGSTTRIMNTQEFVKTLVGLKPNFVLMELVHGMPRDAGSAAFKLGRCFGAIEGICRALDIELEFAVPSVWKRKTRTPADKKEALRRAREEYPNLLGDLNLEKHHNRADALMLLKYVEEIRPT